MIDGFIIDTKQYMSPRVRYVLMSDDTREKLDHAVEGCYVLKGQPHDLDTSTGTGEVFSVLAKSWYEIVTGKK